MIYDKFTAPAGNGILFQPNKSLLHVNPSEPEEAQIL